MLIMQFRLGPGFKRSADEREGPIKQTQSLKIKHHPDGKKKVTDNSIPLCLFERLTPIRDRCYLMVMYSVILEINFKGIWYENHHCVTRSSITKRVSVINSKVALNFLLMVKVAYNTAKYKKSLFCSFQRNNIFIST